MDGSQLTGLSVFANGVYPVEISRGKRINAKKRVPVLASVDASTGEVHFHIDQEAINILQGDHD